MPEPLFSKNEPRKMKAATGKRTMMLKKFLISHSSLHAEEIYRRHKAQNFNQ